MSTGTPDAVPTAAPIPQAPPRPPGGPNPVAENHWYDDALDVLDVVGPVVLGAVEVISTFTDD